MTQRNYLESDFQRDAGRYFRHKLDRSALIEYKVSDTDSINFSRLEPHQFAALKAAKHNRLYHKISDGTLDQKPADSFLLAKTDAWIVIMFRAKERGQKEFFLIDIDVWGVEMNKERKSLTEEKAKEIGVRCLLT